MSQIAFKQLTTTRLTTTKQYDTLNRLTSIGSVPAADNPLVYGYQYNEANQRIRVNLADGAYWLYRYDSLGQVISGKKYFADNTPVPGQQFEYGFDDIGNRLSTKSGGDQNGASLRSASYTPNLLNQITTRSVPGGFDVVGLAPVAASATVNSSSVDYRRGEYYQELLSPANTSVSVWQSVAVATSGGGSASGNVYVPKTPENFSYDTDGNQTVDGRWNYTWDAENRLIRMVANTAVGPQQRIDYGYDAKGRRISKKVWNNTAGTGSPATYNRFIYDGWNLLAELDGNNTNGIVRSYIWGSDLSGSMQGAGGVGALLMINDPTAVSTHFVAYDGNGNVAATVSGSAGTTTATYEYGPFGEVIRSSGTISKTNPYRFSTKYQDNETDLLYYGYRYYNPSTGSWPSRDPLGEPGFMLFQPLEPTLDGGPNLYGFVGNSPLNYVDELGLAYGNPVSGPNGPVSPADPYSPGGAYYIYNPRPPTCVESCVAQHLLGITVDTTVVVSGQPILHNRFILPGSSRGTSIAGKMTDVILQDAKLPGRWPTISGGCCPRIAYTKSASRFVSRWIPFVGWAMLTYDAAGLAGCVCACKGI